MIFSWEVLCWNSKQGSNDGNPTLLRDTFDDEIKLAGPEASVLERTTQTLDLDAIRDSKPSETGARDHCDQMDVDVDAFNYLAYLGREKVNGHQVHEMLVTNVV